MTFRFRDFTTVKYRNLEKKKKTYAKTHLFEDPFKIKFREISIFSEKINGGLLLSENEIDSYVERIKKFNNHSNLSPDILFVSFCLLKRMKNRDITDELLNYGLEESKKIFNIKKEQEEIFKINLLSYIDMINKYLYSELQYDNSEDDYRMEYYYDDEADDYNDVFNTEYFLN